jgi:CheY-like chemotaxis protein
MAGDYDLVLMDMRMPATDGYEAARRIREFETRTGRARTPVIAMTAHAMQSEAQKSLLAGCGMHLPKPVKKSALLAAIRGCMAGKEWWSGEGGEK